MAAAFGGDLVENSLRCLAGLRLQSHPDSFFVWVRLPEAVRAEPLTVRLAELLDRFVEHRAETADLERLEELCGMVRATSLCGLGQTAPNPVLSTLRYFPAEYQAYLDGGPV